MEYRQITRSRITLFFIAGGIFLLLLSLGAVGDEGQYPLWFVISAMASTGLVCGGLFLMKSPPPQDDSKEDAISFEESRLETLVTLSRMTEAPPDEILEFSMEEAIRLTRSQVGYIAFLDDEQTTLSIVAWSKEAMKQCKMQDQPLVYPLKSTGLWGEAVRQKKAIITNDYTAPNPLKKGHPEGHVKILRHMNLPIFSEDKVVAVAGVANKKDPYNETDIRQVTLLMQGMWRLIARQKASESLVEDLVESERKLFTLMNSLPGMAYRCLNDKDWTMEFVSQGCRDLTGYEHWELIGNKVKSYNDVIHPDDQDMVWDDVQAGVSRRKPYHSSYRIVTKSGEVKWVWEKGQGVFNQAGEFVALEGFITSISERIQALEALRYLQDLLSNIVNSMPSVLVAVDEAGLVTQWNQEAEKVTGLDSVQAEGRPLEDVLPWMADKMELIPKAIATGKVQTLSKVTLILDNMKHFYDFTVFPLVSEGPKGAVIRIDDTTEGVRMDEMMLRSEKMLSLGGLAAGMAHEINNPLAGIMQNAQVVANRLSNDTSINREAATESGISLDGLSQYLNKRDILTMLNLIQDAGERAATIVDNMLGFSRINEQGAFQDAHIDKLVDMALEIASKDFDLKKKFDFRQIRIEKEYAPNTPPIPCEQGEMIQVFLNLFRNAAHAMKNRPPQNVKPTIALKISHDDSWVRIEVEDNGPGIPPQITDRIFEPFFTTKAVGEGTGLGLSVSYFIVTQTHQGALEVQSPPGKGARFIISLPLESSASHE